jgi:hypothetical protein
VCCVPTVGWCYFHFVVLNRLSPGVDDQPVISLDSEGEIEEGEEESSVGLVIR